MAEIGDGLFARGDCEPPGHRAMSESGKLREDEPHPVALLLTAAQFGDDPRVDRSLFDDIQWGDETFLDLVESTALLSTDFPLLLLCMARPELVERQPRVARERCGSARSPRRRGRADR